MIARAVVQRGTRVRVRGRTVIRYRNVAATTVRGRAADVAVRLPTPGTFLVRIVYADGGRVRTSAPLTLIARARRR